MLVSYATWCVPLGFLPHTLAIALRWNETGRFPYWGNYEVFGAYAWAIILFLLIFQALKPNLKIIGVFVLPFAFMMIGIAIMSSEEGREIPRTYFTYWLGIHVLFAKLSYSSVLISAVLATSYLMVTRGKIVDMAYPLLAKLPGPERIDFYSYRFAAFAFVMLGAMIASGSVWAYKAWGRYWGWDPIETWAFVSWLVYGLYLHLRSTMGWQGKKASWLNIFAFALVIFSFFGIPFFYPSAHEHLKY
ncbi:MAG: cytochrome c biogenesis protein CcsA [Actinobacteria bacterium]|nr:cytochrome c biogenesis protein CcsA [Actinomycetota bacterium]